MYGVYCGYMFYGDCYSKKYKEVTEELHWTCFCKLKWKAQHEDYSAMEYLASQYLDAKNNPELAAPYLTITAARGMEHSISMALRFCAREKNYGFTPIFIKQAFDAAHKNGLTNSNSLEQYWKAGKVQGCPAA